MNALGDPDHFVRLRLLSLDRLVRVFLANKVDTGALVRPPLSDLAETGNAEDD